MGITGLIPFVEKASSHINLKEIRGSTVAVDTYCWLHKGTVACADKLARGEDSDAYVQYCLRYIQLLRSHHIRPIMVFDGRHLPAKALTEKRRRESRQQASKRAAELMRLGRHDEARTQLRRCIDVTHSMALRLIRECRKQNIDCIVAPYEADAQMAWLNKVNLAQYVVTEDSDLLLFGSKKVIFKLDLLGNALLVQADRLHLTMGCRIEKYDFEKFRRMCILSGCDYVDSLPGIGLAKACKFFLKTDETNMLRGLKKIPSYLNMKHLEVNDEYIENFLKAEATFKHMYIYNPCERQMERLYSLDEYETDAKYCVNAGETIDSEQAFQLALGNLNPMNLQSMDNWHPNMITISDKCDSMFKKWTSIWHKKCDDTSEAELKTFAIDKTSPISKIRAFYSRELDTSPSMKIIDEKDTIENLYVKKKKEYTESVNFYEGKINSCKDILDKDEMVSKLNHNDAKSSCRNPFSKDLNTNIVVKSRFFHTTSPNSNNSIQMIKTRHIGLSSSSLRDNTIPQRNIRRDGIVQVVSNSPRKSLKSCSPLTIKQESEIEENIEIPSESVIELKKLNVNLITQLPDKSQDVEEPIVMQPTTKKSFKLKPLDTPFISPLIVDEEKQTQINSTNTGQELNFIGIQSKLANDPEIIEIDSSPVKLRKRRCTSSPETVDLLLVNHKKQSLLSMFGFQKRSSIK